MSAMCSKEKEVLLTIIDLYKDMPYLWKKDHSDYMNKDARTEGFRVLLEVYKKFDGKATTNTIKKKIENMRTNYAKELKKVLASKHTGAGADEVYSPSLWYFNALSFLGNRTESCRTVTDSLEDENLLSDDDNVSVAASSNSQKRKRKESLIQKQGQLIDTAERLVSNLSQKDEQWEVFGRSVAFQMKDLNENQLIICQKLISDAIFCAKLCKLNENSYIVNPSKEPTFQLHNFNSSSPTSSHSSPSPHTSFYPSYHTQLVRQQLQTLTQPFNKVLVHQITKSPNRQPSPYRQPIPSPSRPQSPYYNLPSPSTSNSQDQSHFIHHVQSPTHLPVPSPSLQQSTYHNHPSPSTSNSQDQSHFIHHVQSPTHLPVPSPSLQQSTYHNHPSPSTSNSQDQSHFILHVQSPTHLPVPSPSLQQSTYHNHPSPSTSNSQHQSYFTHHHQSQQVQVEVDSVDELSQILSEENSSETNVLLPNIMEGSTRDLKKFLIFKPHK